MLRRLFTVSGFTLLSRVFGLLRDLVMAAILGAGPVADAFMLAFRLPNHFRAILAEGAFNAAFVPTYASLSAKEGAGAARAFRSTILGWLVLANLPILALALLSTPLVLDALAPGLAAGDPVYPLAETLTRITFPYLLCMSVVALVSGVLNASGRFAAAAAAPILLNLAMIATLLGAERFASPSHAAAWGVLAGGVAQVALLLIAQRRAGLGFALPLPRLTPEARLFFRRLGPALLTSGALQIAIFADTIVATFLPTGALSHLYYADRLYQLPVGVIGIALGTVLLPEIGKLAGLGDTEGMRRASTQALALCLTVGLPLALLMALLGPQGIALLFQRGAFDAAAVAGSAAVLAGYALGLVPALALRSLVAGFHGRGDMRRPLTALLLATAVNVVLKMALAGPMGAAGLALATSAGAWVYAGQLYATSLARGWVAPVAGRVLLREALANLAAAGAVWAARDAALALPVPQPLHLLAGVLLLVALYAGVWAALRVALRRITG